MDKADLLRLARREVVVKTKVDYFKKISEDVLDFMLYKKIDKGDHLVSGYVLYDKYMSYCKERKHDPYSPNKFFSGMLTYVEKKSINNSPYNKKFLLKRISYYKINKRYKVTEEEMMQLVEKYRDKFDYRSASRKKQREQRNKEKEAGKTS